LNGNVQWFVTVPNDHMFAANQKQQPPWKNNCHLISSDIWPTPASYPQSIQTFSFPKTM
jgi:hypothetical protein